MVCIRTANCSTLDRRERTAVGQERRSVHSLFYTTAGARSASEMRHRPVIGGLRRQVGIADLAC